MVNGSTPQQEFILQGDVVGIPSVP